MMVLLLSQLAGAAMWGAVASARAEKAHLAVARPLPAALGAAEALLAVGVAGGAAAGRQAYEVSGPNMKAHSRCAISYQQGVAG